MKKIAVLTSGGDAPGMNCVLYTMAQLAARYHITLVGINNGFAGAHAGAFLALTPTQLAPYFNRGGTMLGTSRFPQLVDPQVCAQVVAQLRGASIEGLVVIGGEGSYQGAFCLSEAGMPVICLPGSIDNDVPGTDYSIGFFSALEYAIQAIDRLHDTAASHQRISLVEIMGRSCADLTRLAAQAGRCHYLLLPHMALDRGALLSHLKEQLAQGETHLIVAITEQLCDIYALAAYIEGEMGRETRATVLGHVQRGGSPVGADRLLAVRLATFTMERLLQEPTAVAVGIHREQLQCGELSSLVRAVSHQQSQDTAEAVPFRPVVSAVDA